MSKPKTLVLVDGSSYLYRAYHAMPDLRAVGMGRTAAGRGWFGITPRGAYVSQDVRVAEILPAWAWLILAAGLTLLAWLREGRMSLRKA